MRFANAALAPLFLVGLGQAAPVWAVETGTLLQTLRAVGPKGGGNVEAAEAWKRLARADATQLPEILAGLDGASPLGANWIRTAVDAIAERTLDQGGALPTGRLEQFLLDRKQHPRGRRLAYELLLRVDPSAKERFIPEMLDDPSLEMRRDAVARLIVEGEGLIEAKKNETGAAVYRRALTSARDLDQIKLLADRLGKLKQTVDLPRHFGFLTRWKVIGPFDNTDEKGYDVVYPPEKELKQTAVYQGKQGTVRWLDHETKDAYGMVDFNKVLAEEKSVVAYAWTEFVSDREREVQMRLTSVSAVKLWLNSRLIDEHHVYHGGSEFDQYTSHGTLQPGKNTILVKACQNAQTQSWTNKWLFHLRICDEDGGAILSADREK